MEQNSVCLRPFEVVWYQVRRVTHECPKLATSSNSTSEWARSHGHENLAMRALVSCYTIEAIYSSLFVSCCFLFLAP